MYVLKKLIYIIIGKIQNIFFIFALGIDSQNVKEELGMKNNKMITLFLLLTIILSIILLYNNFIDDRAVIKNNFGVDFCDLKLKKISENEEWNPNGDGIKIQIFELLNLSPKLNDLDRCPIKEVLPPNQIPKRFLKITNGYYKCVIDKDDKRDFNILIIDAERKEMCIYYQIM